MFGKEISDGGIERMVDVHPLGDIGFRSKASWESEDTCVGSVGSSIILGFVVVYSTS